MHALKATVLDDDHFRLLAIPFTGPIDGRDMDRQFFSPRTNIHPALLPARLVDWHHGKDPLMGRTVLGKAILDDEPEDDGWWVEVWLNHGEKRLQTIRKLADEAEKRGTGVQIYGSSEALWSKASADGEILDWPYWRQTLSTSPQNTHSIVRPAMKATLDEMTTAGIAVDDHVRSFIADLDALGVDLRSTSLGEDAAKAGRVIAGRNEVRLREARDRLSESYSDPRRWKEALAALDEVLGELERYTQPT
jgi:hypothetical protein